MEQQGCPHTSTTPAFRLQVCLSPFCTNPSRVACDFCLYSLHLHGTIDSVKLCKINEELAPVMQLAQQRIHIEREMEEAAEVQIDRFIEMVKTRKIQMSMFYDNIFSGKVAKGLVELSEGKVHDHRLIKRLMERGVIEQSRVPETIEKLKNVSAMKKLLSPKSPKTSPMPKRLFVVNPDPVPKSLEPSNCNSSNEKSCCHTRETSDSMPLPGRYKNSRQIQQQSFISEPIGIQHG